ncbi:MAG: MFS transporter [Anaerolineae bacterium]|nr:MFS transporter [Anaerolineae bacterium]
MKRWFSGLNPDFNKLWLGQSVSEFGSRITRSGIPLIAVITLGASPAQMGVLTAFASIPVLLFGLFVGVWVDRLPRRPIMIGVDLLRLALLLTIPAAALSGHLSIELLYVIVAALSVLGLVFETAYRAYLPSVVERDQIVEGNSRLSTTDALAEIGGPAVAGVLIQVISAPLAILFDALTFLFSASSFTLIRKREAKPKPSGDTPSVMREIAEGVRVIARDPVLRTLAISLGLHSFFGSFYGTLYDLYGIRDLGLTPGILGFLIAAGGIGALAGAVLASRVQRRFGLGRILVGAMLVNALVGLLTPLAGGSILLASAMLATAQIVGDAAMIVYWINAVSLRQLIVPDHLLGRTNASFGFLAEGVAPAGALIAGVVASGIGARLTLLIAVLGILGVALWVSRSPIRRLEGFAALEPVITSESASAST